MKIYFDGEERADIGGEGASSILSAVHQKAAEAGRVVTEIKLDGVAMDEEAFSRVSGGLTVSFTSRPVRGLVLESLDEASQYVPRLVKGLQEIALHFEKKEFAIGEGKLADGAEGLDWLLRVFQRCGTLLAVDDEFADLTAALTESVNSLGAFHAEKKYLQMAFCIRQKLVPEIEKFSPRIQKLRDLATATQ